MPTKTPKKSTKKVAKRSAKTATKVPKAKEVKVKVEHAVVMSSQAAEDILMRFFQVVGDLRNERESKTFLLDFLTESERSTFAKRLAIGLELQSGKSYEDVRKMFGVSSATISTVAGMMKSPGMQLALKKISTEKWADQLSKKFFQVFRI